MKVTTLSVKATIPTSQYANIIPEVTVEVDGDYDEAKKEAMKYIAEFSQQYAEGDKAISDGQPRTVKAVKLTPYIGEGEIFFEAESHTYMDKDGNVFQSGSQFAKQFEQPFDVNNIVPKYAAKFGEEEQTIKDFWKAKADASTTFGTAMHQALETYGKYADLATKLSTPEKNVTTGVNATLSEAVLRFFTAERMSETAVYEPFVVDSKGKKCGQIDRLVIVDADKKICDIEDYKTNADLYKQNSPKYLKAPYDNLPNQPISGYVLQLNFYRSILEANGWTVRNLVIHHWTDFEWITTMLDKVEV